MTLLITLGVVLAVVCLAAVVYCCLVMGARYDELQRAARIRDEIRKRLEEANDGNE